MTRRSMGNIGRTGGRRRRKDENTYEILKEKNSKLWLPG